MQDWGGFALAIAAFFASHAVPVRPAVKAWLVARLGRSGFGMAYGLLSLVMLAWVIQAAWAAPFVVLWDQAIWQRWLVNAVMLAAVLLAAFAIGAVNPFSFGGRSSGFDPERPGIAGVSRHPLLLVLLLWAAAHLLVNGDLAHVLVFAPFAAFAALGMRAIDARNRRIWGDAEWDRLAARTSGWPFAALLGGRWKPQSGPGLLRLAIGLAVWGGLIWLHPLVIGMPPLP
ncbi:NnrUfamily protein [Rhodobacter ferrooxidans]|uniref:NnrUfamily protein n=2 Tax=Rhodobacter ferrooxidans TaxID=371731 RepID=C8RZA0_9RHOB|nr:NnrUfamily protein [Rhodobacter sp. SW2]